MDTAICQTLALARFLAHLSLKRRAEWPFTCSMIFDPAAFCYISTSRGFWRYLKGATRTVSRL